MAFGFDPSLILATARPQVPTPNETLRTLADLAGAAQQRRQAQAQLDATLREQERAATLADIYRQHANAPQGLPTALLQGGFGEQAFAAQDQRAQMEKQRIEGERALFDYQREQEKRIGDLFQGVSDQTAWARAREQVPEAFRAKIPEAFDPTAAQQLAALSVPAERRAQFDATAAENAKRRQFEASESAKDRAAREAAERAKVGREATSKERKAVDDLRKEFIGLPQTKRIVEVNEARRKIVTATPDGAGDLSLIYGYMKLLDPGSAVKEGEFANAAKTEGIPGQILALRNQALAEGMLSDAARRGILREAAKLYAAHRESFAPTEALYRRIAEQRGIAPENVVPDLGLDGKVQPKKAADPEEQKARDWLEKHPDDPLAPEIRRALGDE